MISGIDVSEWQGHVDFNAVKASGVKFVLIRAGYGVRTKIVKREEVGGQSNEK